MKEDRIYLKDFMDMVKRIDLVVFEMNYLMENLEEKMKSRPLTEKEEAEHNLLVHLMNMANK